MKIEVKGSQNISTFSQKLSGKLSDRNQKLLYDRLESVSVEVRVVRQVRIIKLWTKNLELKMEKKSL